MGYYRQCRTAQSDRTGWDNSVFIQIIVVAGYVPRSISHRGSHVAYIVL